MTAYTPRHDTQYEPRSAYSALDCNMAAVADAARWYSLGLTDHSHAYYRGLSGDTVGGTNIDTAHDVLDKVGISSGTYDQMDGRTWAHVLAALRAGRSVIAHGDYGSVPVGLRGPIDRTFTGYHSVFLCRASTTAVLVGDGLNESWIWWSYATVDAYMRDFPGRGATYLDIPHRRLCAKVPVANVRPEPNRKHARFATITPKSRIHAGGTVRGESIGGNATWYRVWIKDRIGYVHSSVGRYA